MKLLLFTPVFSPIVRLFYKKNFKQKILALPLFIAIFYLIYFFIVH